MSSSAATDIVLTQGGKTTASRLIHRTRYPMSRIPSIVAICLSAVLFGLSPSPAVPQTSVTSPSPSGPRYRADGPNADGFGIKEGYPACKGLAYVNATHCRVGALSRYDTLFPARVIKAPKLAARLSRVTTEPDIRYTFAGREWTLDDYLDRHPVTGLLIAKDTTILVERYQYGRTDSDRLASFSMAKTILGLLIGIAVKEGAIRSIDDSADNYVAGLKGTEYGRTPIKALLRMSSGVAFAEDYADKIQRHLHLGAPHA